LALLLQEKFDAFEAA
jgi:hypothetical protein